MADSAETPQPAGVPQSYKMFAGKDAAVDISVSKPHSRIVLKSENIFRCCVLASGFGASLYVDA
jgi:hypothetical protein